MTIFRFSAWMATALLWAPVSAPSVASIGQDSQVADECSNIDPFTKRECVGARIERKERAMAQLLVEARAAVSRSFAAYGNSDNRTDPVFLDRSQSAWGSYADNNCIVAAALGGGSNSAISDRATECMEREIDQRIAFLQSLVDEERSWSE